jgi:hypothetical protein
MIRVTLRHLSRDDTCHVMTRVHAASLFSLSEKLFDGSFFLDFFRVTKDEKRSWTLYSTNTVVSFSLCVCIV